MKSKAMAIICDIDGTLAHRNDRSPYDYSKVGEDEVDPVVRDILECLSCWNGTHIIMVSGREDSCYTETSNWLNENLSKRSPYAELYMRKTGDHRSDDIIKREIYEEYIKDYYEVAFVLDDRDRVVKMWRELGLKCLQVAEGDF